MNEIRVDYEIKLDHGSFTVYYYGWRLKNFDTIAEAHDYIAYGISLGRLDD